MVIHGLRHQSPSDMCFHVTRNFTNGREDFDSALEMDGKRSAMNFAARITVSICYLFM
jgi:hypothetical protein